MFERKQITVEYKNDGQLVTLYDRAKSKSVKGSLILVQREVQRQELNQQVEAKPIVVEKKQVQPQKLSAQQVRERREIEKTAKSVVIQPKKEFRLPKPQISLSPKIGRVLAMFCLILSIIGFVYTTAPVIGAFYLAKNAPAIDPPKGSLPIEARMAEVTPLPTYQPVDLENFYLTIPKINLDSKIMANVDMNAETEYQAKLLETGVAHAKGSYLPSEEGPTVLFAHSTDTLDHIVTYNAKFFAAKDLVAGDEIVIQFDHKLYRYQVLGQEIVDANDIEAIRQTEADLVLLTCYPPGTSWKRLLVFAKQI